MYETKSKYFIGNIDTIQKTGLYYTVTGWVVPLITADNCIIGCEGFISAEAQEREDIYSLFKKSHINYLRSGFKLIFNPQIEDTPIIINGEHVFTVTAEVLESIVQSSNIKNINSIVIDNFYDNPDKVRNYALRQEYIERSNTRRSIKTFHPHWIQLSFENFLNKKIKNFTLDSGIFQFQTSADLIRYNTKDTEYFAIVFLHDTPPHNTGLSLYKQLNTSINDVFDKTNFKLIDQIENIFNRLIILNAKLTHGFTANYGKDKSTSRLIHTFNFNTC